MTRFNEVKPEDFQKSPFQLIGHDWFLLTAEKDGICNTMTASWGGLGVMWGKNVAFIVIRPQRYTKELIDQADTFSMSFLDGGYRKTLNYMGSTSGRDENKIEKSQLTVAHYNGTPYFEEATHVFICRKLFAQLDSPDSFIDKSFREKWYPKADYHTLYIAEISSLFTKEG